MFHGITSSDSMFSVRQVPWHGFGAVLDDYPRSIDEALRIVSDAYEVVEKP